LLKCSPPLAVQHEGLRASPDIPGALALREAFVSDRLTVQAVGDSSAIGRLTIDLDPGKVEAIVLMR